MVPNQDPIVGRWTYRSFINNPDISTDFDSLEWGRGELLIEYLAPGVFIGRLLFGPSYQFRLQGWASFGYPPLFRFRGVGDAADSQNQVYDYLACLNPFWPDGVNQRPVLTGSVIRSVAHNGGRAPAGAVGTFTAVKQ